MYVPRSKRYAERPVGVRDTTGQLCPDAFRHATFAVIMYYVTFKITGERQCVWELAFTNKEDRKVNERLSLAEARMVIDEFDLVEVLRNKYGIIYDHTDGRFLEKYGKV